MSVLVLDPDFKTQIGAHLTAIRKIVGEAEISANKRDAIFRPINNLQEEVDRDRTRTEAAFALLLDLTSAISNGAKNLDPALEAALKSPPGFSSQASDSLTDLAAPILLVRSRRQAAKNPRHLPGVFR